MTEEDIEIRIKYLNRDYTIGNEASEFIKKIDNIIGNAAIEIQSLFIYDIDNESYIRALDHLIESKNALIVSFLLGQQKFKLQLENERRIINIQNKSNNTLDTNNTIKN